ncbi:Alpha/Beta hydrolase protein [Podospora fimiseda]|uniref:Alpha/Beta hydrolase protein n=1 Tax=Podospora fimiseda TaxID=252190 RepID=A0AAN7BTR3_9PEZI|nr:Alpha/Beta hydrolase protein [Podospora fimiseda]
MAATTTPNTAMGRPEFEEELFIYNQPQSQRRHVPKRLREWISTGITIIILYILIYPPSFNTKPSITKRDSPYGQFPLSKDPFHFLPCTSTTLPPPLNDTSPERTWAALFDPNPAHWSWGKPSNDHEATENTYAGRGIYLCGWLDVPLDYTNKSDTRIARLAVTKYQVSGLAPSNGLNAHSSAGKKSERTIVIEPGGPGGSGTSYAWRAAENITQRLSDAKFDVLGWDPRGVNASLPAISCFPHDADRDRWGLITQQHRAVVSGYRTQVELADAMNAALMRACWELHGDLPRFVSTAFVARDVEQIRLALGEDGLSGYFVSYGTGIGQTYANMFPDSVGNLILDGTEYVRDHRLRGGFGWTALDNATDAWHDGFLGECIKAGPEHCALAKPKDEDPVTLEDLESRMKALISSLADRPAPGYTKEGGPTMVTYSAFVDSIYGAMYNANSWPALAQTLYDLETGNTTLAAAMMERNWYFDPEEACSLTPEVPSSEELTTLVICADSYDASEPDDIDWWLALWKDMSAKNWIAGNSRFYGALPCRHFGTYWPKPAEVYRGDLNHKLKNPVLLIAETYDPATPLRNGRRLLDEMGSNARLIVHHGYGHSSRDTSKCTDSLAKAYIVNGTLPDEAETDCYADEKPYLYGVGKGPTSFAKSAQEKDYLKIWREHLEELRLWNPRLLPA